MVFSNLIQDRHLQCIEFLKTKTDIYGVVWKFFIDGYEACKLSRVCIWILYEIFNDGEKDQNEYSIFNDGEKGQNEYSMIKVYYLISLFN